MKPNNQPNISALANMSTDGAVIPTVQVFQCSAQLVATGSAAGTLKLQFSNDVVPTPVAPTNWNDITDATVSVAGIGSYGIEKTELCYNYIRAVYTDSSSGMATGTVVVQVFTLGI